MSWTCIVALATVLTAQSNAALERSRAALGEAEFELALTWAEQAEAEAEDAHGLAEVYRQQGLVREVLGRNDHAVVAFARALRCDSSITLDPRTTKRTTADLFSLARAMHEAGTDVLRIRRRLEPRVGRDATLCRSPQAVPEAIVGRAPDGGGGVGWPVWTMAGVAVASGATAGVLGSLAIARNHECNEASTATIYDKCSSQASALETGTNIAWTAAGVSAATAILVWWLSD